MIKKSLHLFLATASLCGSISLYGDPLATMDGSEITATMFRAAISELGPSGDIIKTNQEVKAKYLDHIIDTTLLSGKAQSDRLDQNREYQVQIERAKREILAKMYLDNYLAEATTPAKLKEYFGKNKLMFSNKEVKASHILFKEEDKKNAEAVLKNALAKNADFEALAKKYSTGPNAAAGGDLGYFSRGRMIPEFEEVAFTTAKDKTHPALVKTQYGYHIIKITDIRGDDNAAFEDKIIEVERKVAALAKEALVAELRTKAKVKIDTTALEKFQY